MLTMLLVGFLPITAFAVEETKPAETFQSICLKSWMERANEAEDKVDFQNFGEKYCDCAATQQPLTTNEDVAKAAKVCMSRILLQDSMDNLTDELELSDVTEADVNEYCLDRWKLIYPSMDDKIKKTSEDYCSCAKPKLLELIKKMDSKTDKQFAAEINEVAANCSGQVGK